MRAYQMQAKALGDLLEEIGWEESDLVVPFCALDIARHGWAAMIALHFLAECERFAAFDYAMGETRAEAACEAGGRRIEAEHELALIDAACEQAGFTIAELKP
jgi:hypothetical protein